MLCIVGTFLHVSPILVTCKLLYSIHFFFSSIEYVLICEISKKRTCNGSTLPPHLGKEQSQKHPNAQPKAHFNPRSHEGSDRAVIRTWRHISYFNPRSREGSDSVERRFTKSLSVFQSTLPHRERPLFLGDEFSVQIFQSTLPHGERLASHESHHLGFQFQSTLPHGERPVLVLLMLQLLISIHAPARGATLPDLVCRTLFTISIHAPARGAT